MSQGHAIVGTHATVPAGADVVTFKPRPDRFGLRPLDRRLERAGLAIATAVVDALDDGDASLVHMPTVTAVLGILAAEAALGAASMHARAALDVRTGGWIIGGPADSILFRHDGAQGGSTICALLFDAAVEAGVSVHALPDLDGVVAQAEARIGQKPYPVYSVAPALRPHGLPRATAARLRHDLHRRAADEGFCTPHEQALACGAAIAAVIVREPSPVPLVQLAAEAVIAGARQAPLPFAAG